MKYYLQNVYLSRVLFLVGLDAICLMLASWIAWVLVEPDLPAALYAGATAGGTFLTFLALFFCNAYHPSVIGNGRRTPSAITNSMGLAFAAGIVFYYVLTVPAEVVSCLARTATFYFPLLLIERAVFRAVCSLSRFSRRVLILGTSDLGSEIAQTLCQQQNAGLELVGFLSDELAYQHPGATFAHCNVIGKIHHLEKILDWTRVDHIVVAATDRADHFPGDALQLAKMSGCRVESGVSFLERISGKIYLRGLHPGYLIFSEGFRMGPLSSAVKRAIDIVGSSLGMILVAPVMGLCAVAIKLESKGPVFFRQARLGRRNENFVMLKLRSMRADAEAETGAIFTAHGDERITRVGQFIRRTRLDEFPQLWNILKGEMSLVGPRAERPEFVESLGERYVYYRLRSSVKPGLTGWAQTRHGYVNDVDGYEEKLALDLYYLKHRSLTMDLLILWQTVKIMVLARGM
jgi:exopolysaccharide biosynthesis polyprenyl glycosylphosphotransferase